MTGAAAHAGAGRALPRALLVIASLALAGCGGSDPVVISNVTHIDGIPFDQYDPAQYDPRKDTVITVAAAPPPAQAAAAPVPAPAPVAAATPEPAAAPAPVASDSDGNGFLDLFNNIPLPQPPVAAPVTGGISTVAIVDGREIEVELVDSATGGRPTSAARAVVHVRGVGGQDVSRAIRAYADGCGTSRDSIQSWISAGGRVTYRSAGDTFVFWTGNCPGLARYASGQA